MANSYNDGIRKGRMDVAVRLLDAIKNLLGEPSDAILSQWIGASSASISQWRSGTAAPHRAAIMKMLGQLMSSYVEPWLEIEPVNPQRSGGGWRVDGDATRRTSIRNRIENRIGTYLFYDSMGRVTYVGQAKTNLFYEIEQRLAQTLRHRAYVRKANDNKLKMSNFVQGQVVRFVSAYATMTGPAAHNIEAILLRAFANGHQNRKSAKIRIGEWEA